VSKSADPDQMRRRRHGGWSGSTLLAYMFEGPYSHDAGHMCLLDGIFIIFQQYLSKVFLFSNNIFQYICLIMVHR